MCLMSYLGVFGAQFVQDVGGVKAGIVTQLSGYYLQGLGVRSDQQLLFSRDGPGIVPQVLWQLHLYGSSTGYNGVILEIRNNKLYQISKRSVSVAAFPPKKLY